MKKLQVEGKECQGVISYSQATHDKEIRISLKKTRCYLRYWKSKQDKSNSVIHFKIQKSLFLVRNENQMKGEYPALLLELQSIETPYTLLSSSNLINFSWLVEYWTNIWSEDDLLQNLQMEVVIFLSNEFLTITFIFPVVRNFTSKVILKD